MRADQEHERIRAFDRRFDLVPPLRGLRDVVEIDPNVALRGLEGPAEPRRHLDVLPRIRDEDRAHGRRLYTTRVQLEVRGALPQKVTTRARLTARSAERTVTF